MAELVLLAVLAAPALFPTPGRFVVLLAIPVWWAWRAARRGLGRAGFIPRTPLDVAIALLAFMVLVSVFATDDLLVSLPKIAGVVYGIGVYYGIANVFREPQGPPLEIGLGALALAGPVVAVAGLFGTQWPSKFAVLDWLLVNLPVRLTGLPGAESGLHPNEVAGTLVWVIPPALAAMVYLAGRALSGRTADARWKALAFVGVLGLSALLTVGVLVLTQSRGGLIGLGVAGLAMLGIAVRRARWPLVAIAGLGLIGLLAVLATNGSQELLQMAGGLGRAQGTLGGLDTVEGRIETWNRALGGIQDFPYTGMGLNTFRLLVHLLYPMYLVQPDVDIGHAHNLWLQAALDLGLPGLIAYLAIWLGAAVALIEIWKAASAAGQVGQLARTLVLGLGGGLLAHLFFGLTDAIAIGAKPGVLWWAMLGLIAGLHHRVYLLVETQRAGAWLMSKRSE